MPHYKKIIFMKAIKVRVENGEGAAKKIIETYTKLTDKEKKELLSEF